MGTICVSEGTWGRRSVWEYGTRVVSSEVLSVRFAFPKAHGAGEGADLEAQGQLHAAAAAAHGDAGPEGAHHPGPDADLQPAQARDDRHEAGDEPEDEQAPLVPPTPRRLRVPVLGVVQGLRVPACN